MGKKKERKPKKPLTLYKHYELKGDSVTRNTKFCPKCGPGFFLASHNNRAVCGKCQYMEVRK